MKTSCHDTSAMKGRYHVELCASSLTLLVFLNNHHLLFITSHLHFSSFTPLSCLPLYQDQFLRAAPVSGGVGEFLMRKMGWKTGEGLGRNREGTIEPIIIDFKVDRKGLDRKPGRTHRTDNESEQLNHIFMRVILLMLMAVVADVVCVLGLVAEGEKPQKQTAGLVVTKDLMGNTQQIISCWLICIVVSSYHSHILST